MAVYLKDYLKKFASDKKLDWPNSRDGVVWRANKDLESDRNKLDEAWENIEREFHKDIINKKITKYDLENIKKKIRQAF